LLRAESVHLLELPSVALPDQFERRAGIVSVWSAALRRPVEIAGCVDDQTRGRIIAIGSRAAVDPGATLAAYNASKAALVSLIRTVALENRDAGITANVILPGTMDTPANRQSDPGADFSKWVQPATVASLVVWLAGDQAKDVTGAVIPVYGAGL